MKVLNLIFSVIFALQTPYAFAGTKPKPTPGPAPKITYAAFMAATTMNKPAKERAGVFKYMREHNVDFFAEVPVKLIDGKIWIANMETKWNPKNSTFTWGAKTIKVSPKDPMDVTWQKIYSQLTEKKSAGFSLFPEAHADIDAEAVYKIAGVTSVLTGLVYPLVGASLLKASLGVVATSTGIVFVIALLIAVIVPTQASAAELPQVNSASCNQSGLTIDMNGKKIAASKAGGKLSVSVNGEPASMDAEATKAYGDMVEECKAHPVKDADFKAAIQAVLDEELKKAATPDAGSEAKSAS